MTKRNERSDPMADYIDQTKAKIDKFGWIVQAVFPTEEEPGAFYSYSVGVSAHLDHPEICVSGLDPRLMMQLTNDVAQNIKDNGLDVREPCLVDGVIGNLPVAFRPIAPSSAMGSARLLNRLYGPRPCVQMILPDKNGLFPWDDECDPVWMEQQVEVWDAVGPIPMERFSVAGREPAPRA